MMLLHKPQQGFASQHLLSIFGDLSALSHSVYSSRPQIVDTGWQKAASFQLSVLQQFP